MIKSRLFEGESDISAMRAVLARLGAESAVTDFEEKIQLENVRQTIRLWEKSGRSVGFAYVDGYNNLNFEFLHEERSQELGDAAVEWGETVMREMNARTGQDETLDACFSPRHSWQIQLLERHGFQCEPIRTLIYARSVVQPILPAPLPPEFHMRPTLGEGEVDALVNLHRSAFGTDNMTVEERLAIMRASGYRPALDIVAENSDGDLVAFCIAGIEVDEPKTGYTDPIGVRPEYQHIGLGKALVTRCLELLRQKGVEYVQLGTSSENSAMQGLAQACGFELISEKLWFSKLVSAPGSDLITS